MILLWAILVLYYEWMLKTYHSGCRVCYFDMYFHPQVYQEYLVMEETDVSSLWMPYREILRNSSFPLDFSWDLFCLMDLRP
jgi:hypothetical protein